MTRLTDVTVSDARKSIKLEITQADIQGSIKNDPAHCAAAQAVIRLLGAQEVRIHKTRAYVKLKDEWKRYMVPPAVYREITAFDRGATFEPGEYLLRAPAEGERLGQHTSWRERTRRERQRTAKVETRKTRNVRPDGAHGYELYDALT